MNVNAKIYGIILIVEELKKNVQHMKICVIKKFQVKTI